MREERHEAIFKAAARATRARIHRDRARAPRSLAKVFTVVSRRLFQELSAEAAWAAAGIRDADMKATFTAATGVPLGRYIADARIEVANVLMATTDLDLGSISLMLGYDNHRTFTANYKRVKGRTPSAMPRQHLLTSPLMDLETSLLAARGLLEDEAAASYLEDLLRSYPSAARRIRGGQAAVAEPQVLVSGARCDQLEAEGLWQAIRDLPFREQCRKVRRYHFCSEVFFDLLRKKSRHEGRKSRQRGIELAELALVSLETSDQVFGERIHDLRALGWAWVGNAHRLALDFSAAGAAFEHADREWAKPRAHNDLRVLAKICYLKGTLRMVRREYAEATQNLDRCCSLHRQLEQAREEARALIHRAAIHGYAGKLREAIGDLREAVGLIDEVKEHDLAFAARGNLANALARAGRLESAAEELDRARQLQCTVADSLGAPHLDSIAGYICELQGDLGAARRLYLTAANGFRDADELIYYGVVSVDLMIVHAMLDDWGRVKELASETLPLLSSMDLHTETVAATGLLAKAIEADELSRQLLKNLRAALRQDPLAM